MGCGASQGQVAPVQNAKDTEREPKPRNKPPQKTKANGKVPSSVPASVSFEIGLDENNLNIIAKHPPRRLQKLEPMQNKPNLTPEMVENKLREAEEKRNKKLQEKVKISKRTSKLREEILRAREVEKDEQKQQKDEIAHKLSAAERKREAQLKDKEEKQRIREERARRAREKAKRIKAEGEEGIDFEMEKDEAFNADEDDSWLEGENNNETEMIRQDRDDSAVSMGERIYSGRESPLKNPNPKEEARKKLESAGTTDSFDYAFQREQSERQAITTYHDEHQDTTVGDDNFFGS